MLLFDLFFSFLFIFAGHACADCASAGVMTHAEHLLVVEAGRVGVKRLSQNKHFYTEHASIVRHGDLITKPPEAKAKVVCSDLKVKILRDGINPVPCPSDPIHFYHGLGKMMPLRKSDYHAYPRLISPRRTRLTHVSPVIVWDPIEGVREYTVIIDGVGVTWEIDSLSSRLSIASHRDVVLERGESYSVVIVGGGRRSSEEGFRDIEFSVLGGKEYRNFRLALSKVKDKDLASDSLSLVKGYLYASWDLNTEAVAFLRTAREEFGQPLAAYLLGSVYMKVGLYPEAHKSYQEAVDGFQEEGNDEGVALGKGMLGCIKSNVFGYSEKALPDLRDARDLFVKLGDCQGALEIQREIDAVKFSSAKEDRGEPCEREAVSTLLKGFAGNVTDVQDSLRRRQESYISKYLCQDALDMQIQLNMLSECSSSGSADGPRFCFENFGPPTPWGK